MKMKQVAERIGKHENTIRNWSDWYAEFLSPAPPKGEARFFTDDDLRVLAYIRELSAKGLSRQPIQESLRSKFESQVPFPPVQPDTLIDLDAQQETALALAEVRTELTTAQTALILKDAQLKEFSATINELREQVQYLRVAHEQERSAFTARLNELMERYMDKYTERADRVGDKYAGEIAALREQIGQLRQQVIDTGQSEQQHLTEVAHLNQIIDRLKQQLEQTRSDKSVEDK